MAKRKTKAAPKKELEAYQIDLIGVSLILISIIGLCKWGILGNIVKAFAAFLVGNLYGLLLIGLIIVGIYLMFKKHLPNFFTGKLVGIYISALAILVLCHLFGGYYKDFEGAGFGKDLGTIWGLTNEQLNSFYNTPNLFSGDLGGGVIGMFFSVCLFELVAYQGATLISIVLCVAGFLIATGISIVDLIKSANDSFKESNKERAEKKKQAREAKLIEKERKAISKIEETYDSETEVDNKRVVKMNDILYNEQTGEVVNNNTNEISSGTEVQLQDESIIKGSYTFPPYYLLKAPDKKNNNNVENEQAVVKNKQILVRTLEEFGISGRVVSHHIGPSVTQYELEIKAGTKLSRILSINKELALALAAKEVRIQAPIPGKSTIGIELPNKVISSVSLKEILEPKRNDDKKLLVALGKDIMGDIKTFEINKTPHLLVAGSTGSGKSVCINSMIVSILMRTHPSEVKLVLIDPKKVEFAMYQGVPHLLVPVVTDPKKANVVLQKIVREMERRYEEFENTGTKNIAGYNAFVDSYNETSDDKKIRMPYIVVIIDELADLMLVAAKEVEDSIMRITQMARAAGIHLIVATQRPSTDVITGVIKANIPSRISFAVSSGIDSRTILDMTGAEKLLGKGDMLFLPQGENTPIRIQGTFVSDDEIKAVADYTIKQQKAQYNQAMMVSDEDMGATSMVGSDAMDGDEEPLYNEIVEFVVHEGKASASLLQRRFRIGYNRAARVIDILEQRGIVGPNNGAKAREVLVKVEDEGPTEDFEDE